MTATEFNNLPKEVQGIILAENSISLDERILYNKKKSLFKQFCNKQELSRVLSFFPDLEKT